ncbi:helix-turn-helix domain-containing protein [Rhodococcus sp. W8901]|uniref:helix-turn-helix domain-containing protein n=1 Tax=Rhodococcus sp. W8901 TaxID=2742603 RepID=UPI001583D26C|nr:helix-turn-helix domain-containing protein [Rhodococcus sp. W8901]QKT11605.1 AraC family transcriptional regulator [Rhodococcus sp. W8901]
MPTWARRVNVSPRHLARLFRDEAGSTPGAVVERMRIQAAVEQLVHTDAPLPTVAARAGFGSVAGLHRSFVRHHGLSPGEYRRRFTVRPLGAGQHNGSRRVIGTGTHHGGYPSRRGLSPGSAAA